MIEHGARPKVRVVLKGSLLREGSRIMDASSTVTLIDVSGQLILVDTGSPKTCEELKEALRSMTINPRSVGYVVNTHLHIDHCGCNELFENARFYAHVLENPPVGTVRISGKTTILPGLSLMPTPGHSPGSISVFVEADKRYAICGDAIPTRGNYEAHTPPFVNMDVKLALSSMDAIISWADVVVPGHDFAFEILRKK